MSNKMHDQKKDKSKDYLLGLHWAATTGNVGKCQRTKKKKKKKDIAFIERARGRREGKEERSQKKEGGKREGKRKGFGFLRVCVCVCVKKRDIKRKGAI